MKNTNNWKPSKFEVINEKLIPSKNIGYSSRRMASFIGNFYTEVLPKMCKGDLLDLGCGKVPFYPFYKPLVSSITCVDWGNSYNGNEHIDVFCDLNGKLPFNDNSFDTIILSDVIEHLNNPLNTLCEVKRVIRNGGKIILNYPFLYGIHESPFDFGRYTKFQIQNWSNSLSFNILIEREYGGLIDILEHASIRILKKKRGGRFLEKLIYWIFTKIRTEKNNDDSHTYMYGFVLECVK